MKIYVYILELMDLPNIRELSFFQSFFLKLSSFEGFPLKVCFHHRSLATFPLFNASNPYSAPQINVIGMLFDSKLTFCTFKWLMV